MRSDFHAGNILSCLLSSYLVHRLIHFGPVLGLGQFWVGPVLGLGQFWVWASFGMGQFCLGQFWVWASFGFGPVLFGPDLVRPVMGGQLCLGQFCLDTVFCFLILNG